MTNKKIKSKIAKMIRKGTGYNFVHSLKLAKVILHKMEWENTLENAKLGFIYEFEFDGFNDNQTFQGKIENYNKNIIYDIPYELYILRDTYRNNRRI